tara:strand:+ start:7979 stop:8821 length:843 start_codon:yes stop_codon:yes gene_type:complete
MTINTTTLKANLTTKINNTSGTTDAKEFLLLGKAVEAVSSTGIGSSNIDFGSYKITYSNNYATLSDLPNASTYHGMFAHVHAEAAGFYSHAGAWYKLVNYDTSGNLTISGNLTVNGTTTTINSTTLDVDDLNITVAKGAADAAAANGAGLTVDGASANITYTSATDTWDFNKAITGTYTSLNPVVNTANVVTSQTIDMTKPMHHFNMTGGTAFSGVSVAAGRTSMMILDTTATPHTPTWASDIKWPAATEPTWSDSRYWVVSFTCKDSTTILASAQGYTI